MRGTYLSDRVRPYDGVGPLASLEVDLRLNDQILIGLVLGCGVHAPTTTTTFTTTTTTATTKRVRTQRPDGGWSAPVSVPCEPRLVVTAAPTLRRSARTAARVENHLPKLRGFRNSEVRMAIAGFVGVRPAAELGRLRGGRGGRSRSPEGPQRPRPNINDGYRVGLK